MPIQPFIFVGVGGTGGKTLGVIRKTLDDALVRIGWNEGWPAGWQFIHIDVPADPDANTEDTPYALPRTSYVALTTSRSTYQGFHDAITQELHRATADPVERYFAWDSWHPEPASAVRVEIRNGAGQYRAIGRACVLKSLRHVDQALARSYDLATSAQAAPQLRRVQELSEGRSASVGNIRPVIFVIGSVSGGSGSGMFLDVCDVLRAQGHTEINGVVFTPEVFENPNGVTEPGVAPNTFLALCEISNSMWTHAQADAPLSRDRMFGRAGVRYPVGHGGPSTVFLVGRRNRSVTFNSADDVYKIVGRSLGELTLDEDLTTEVVNYDLANGNAVAAGATDTLELSRPDGNRDVAPFRGLGFARLTVGRDFFSRYATDRLLRRVALRLLDGHLERRRPEDPSSDDELKQQVVQEVWPAFLRDCELDEVREKNAISDPLNTWDQPEVVNARSDFAAKLRNDIVASARRGRTVDNATARSAAATRVRHARTDTSDFNSSVNDATQRLALELNERLQATLQRVILRSVASHGLPVTIALADRLIDRSREGVASLEADRSHVARQISEALQALPQPPAGADTEFPVGSVEDIEKIVQDAHKVLRKHVLLRSLDLSFDYLDDLTLNLLEPWRQALSDVDGLLRLELRPKVGTGPLDLWPGDVGVPEYLRPSKVEFLLDDVDGLPEQFVEVIERSVSGAKGIGAVVTATEQIVAGDALGIRAQTRPVVSIDQPWIPRVEIARPQGTNRATTKVAVRLELEDLNARTHAWMTDQEKYIGQFLRQSLGAYLTDSLVAAPELKTRQSRLVGHFESMITSSLPLVALDPNMTNLVHGHDTPPYNLHVSTLNVPSHLTDVRKRLEDATVALLQTTQAIKFTNDPRPDAIMMTLLKEPYHMLEVASIMNPISKQWSRGGAARDFWQYRRARPLAEWVPIGPDARKALVAGWFAARLLGDASVENASGKTELAVKVNGRSLRIPRQGVRLPDRRDHVGMLLEALPAAMLECFESKSLAGIDVYRHLIALGAAIDDEENLVEAWVSGADRSGAPELAADLANGSSRQEAATELIHQWKRTYERKPKYFGEVAEAQTHPTYEIFTDIIEALDRLQAAVDRTIQREIH